MSDPSRHIACLDVGFQDVGDRAGYFGAENMAVGIVHCLAVIDVDHQQCDVLETSVPEFQVGRGLFDSAAAEQICQWVAERFVLRPLYSSSSSDRKRAPASPFAPGGLPAAMMSASGFVSMYLRFRHHFKNCLALISTRSAMAGMSPFVQSGATSG